MTKLVMDDENQGQPLSSGWQEHNIRNKTELESYEEEIMKGELAFRAKRLIDENPNKKETKMFYAWSAGWFGAQEFDEYEEKLSKQSDS